MGCDSDAEPRPFGLSRYGAIPALAGRGLPTALPAVYRLVPYRGSRCGLRRYERDVATESLPWGARVTYPTRNFATLGSFVTPHSRSGWPGHFCLTPHVAMRLGLYLHRSE